MIKTCTCEGHIANGKMNKAGAIFQDKRYGKFQRVHNKTSSGHRCTICGDEKK